MAPAQPVPDFRAFMVLKGVLSNPPEGLKELLDGPTPGSYEP
jgi:hypothetical protein